MALIEPDWYLSKKRKSGHTKRCQGTICIARIWQPHASSHRGRLPWGPLSPVSPSEWPSYTSYRRQVMCFMFPLWKGRLTATFSHRSWVLKKFVFTNFLSLVKWPMMDPLKPISSRGHHSHRLFCPHRLEPTPPPVLPAGGGDWSEAAVLYHNLKSTLLPTVIFFSCIHEYSIYFWLLMWVSSCTHKIELSTNMRFVSPAF